MMRNMARVYQVATVSETCEEEPIARVHTAIKHQGVNQQFLVLQTPAVYEGYFTHGYG